MFGPSTRPPNVAAPCRGFCRTRVSRRLVGFRSSGRGPVPRPSPIPMPGHAVHLVVEHVGHPALALGAAFALAVFASHGVLGHVELVHRGVEHFELVHFLLHLGQLVRHLGHGLGRVLIVALL